MISSDKMKISHPIDLALSQIASVMIVTIIVAAATNGLNSRQLAAGEPGWRSGASVWNGNGYDLPNAQEEALPNKLVAPQYVSGDLSGLVFGKFSGRNKPDDRNAFIFRGHALGDLALSALALQKSGIGGAEPS